MRANATADPIMPLISDDLVTCHVQCGQVIKMLVVVVVLFAVCWLPLHAFMLVIDFHPELTDYKSTAQKRFCIALYYCVHWLAMSNSFVNPVIYGFLNDCFRVSYRTYVRCQSSLKYGEQWSRRRPIQTHVDSRRRNTLNFEFFKLI